MSALKQSLEKAIQELRDVSPAEPGAAHSGVPARPVAPPQPRPMRAGPPPAPGSIEAALASAPAVSPQYVPPKPPPNAPVNQHPEVTASAMGALSRVAPPARRETTPLPPAKPLPENASLISRMSPASATMHGQPQNLERSPGQDGGAGELIGDVADQAKRLKDTIWRWATIGISCAGGLASGWLGSAVSDQASGLFGSAATEIVGKASKATGVPVPATLRGKALANAEQGTGKADRAAPVDNSLCTILALDRTTGLTLAKPCQSVSGDEVSSQLSKADLLAKPLGSGQ